MPTVERRVKAAEKRELSQKRRRIVRSSGNIVVNALEDLEARMDGVEHQHSLRVINTAFVAPYAAAQQLRVFDDTNICECLEPLEA